MIWMTMTTRMTTIIAKSMCTRCRLPTSHRQLAQTGIIAWKLESRLQDDHRKQCLERVLHLWTIDVFRHTYRSSYAHKLWSCNGKSLPALLECSVDVTFTRFLKWLVKQSWVKLVLYWVSMLGHTDRRNSLKGSIVEETNSNPSESFHSSIHQLDITPSLKLWSQAHSGAI